MAKQRTAAEGAEWCEMHALKRSGKRTDNIVKRVIQSHLIDDLTGER